MPHYVHKHLDLLTSYICLMGDIANHSYITCNYMYKQEIANNFRPTD